MFRKKYRFTHKIISPGIITQHVWGEICSTIGSAPAETGGILGSGDGGRTIAHYYFDSTATTTGGTYTPDIDAINRKIAEWNTLGIPFIGFVHSHPGYHNSPSAEDHGYAISIMKALSMTNFFMPIININSPPDGKIHFYPYAVDKRYRLNKRRIVIEQDYSIAAEHSVMPLEQQFDRIKSIYPLDVLQRKTVVAVGLGGSRQFVEELARSGIGNFVLIDGDTVSTSNIATQQSYLSEVGKYKVDAVRERILDINPEAKVKAVRRFLDDSVSDIDFANIVGKALVQNPADVLICGCTDNFHAQARSAALAMKYGTPYLAAQMYKGGMAAEIYFSYPGATNNGCPRCAMSSRYEAYAAGYKNEVTSHGTPIFATTRVNAAKGQIALMLLLYNEDETCVYNDMLDQVTDRNFAMIRMSPNVDKELGISIFNEAVRNDSGLAFFDETVWIPQTPDNGADGQPVCPLCGGIGDLLALKGNIRDTRTDWGGGQA